jgi:uncharacterized Ntn-hydrolase superfamily protein
MTFSITARCERTGELGVAVATAWFAVGSICPAVRAGVGAVASQALVNPNLREACLDRIAAGAGPELALAEALEMDASPEQRQVGVVDAAGRAAAHTGTACASHSGHRIDGSCVVAGNTLCSVEVLEAMQSAWNEVRISGQPLAECLLVALEAGQAAGGDSRGRQSAALLVGNSDPMLQLDLRVDDHAEPLAELCRLLGLFREKYEPIYRALPSTLRSGS